MYQSLEHIFQLIMRYGILLLEIIGALIILYYSAKSVFFLLRQEHQKSRSAMTDGITTSLTLLLGSEVLNTIIAPGWTEIGMTCAILLMRAGVSILLKWESKDE